MAGLSFVQMPFEPCRNRGLVRCRARAPGRRTTREQHNAFSWGLGPVRIETDGLVHTESQIVGDQVPGLYLSGIAGIIEADIDRTIARKHQIRLELQPERVVELVLG